MDGRLITEDEKNTIVKMMVSKGWEYYNHEDSDKEIFGGDYSLFFTIPIGDEIGKVKEVVGRNHFSPRGYRYVSIFSSYATSHINGEFRHYRQRKYNTHSRDILNIFSYGKNNDPVENARIFLDDYDKLKYNRA